MNRLSTAPWLSGAALQCGETPGFHHVYKEIQTRPIVVVVIDLPPQGIVGG